MDALQELISLVEQQRVHLVCIQNGKDIEVRELDFEGYSDRDYFLVTVNDLYRKSMREFGTGLKQRKTLDERRIYITEITRAIKKALRGYSSKNLFDPALEVTRSVIVCAHSAVNYYDEIELEKNKFDLLVEPFVAVLHEYGERLHDYILNYRQLFPGAIKVNSEGSEPAMPKLFWDGTQTQLVELLWTLVEGGYLKNDRERVTKAEKSSVMKYFSLLFNVDLKNYDKLIGRALDRETKKVNRDILKELHDIFKEAQKKKQNKAPKS